MAAPQGVEVAQTDLEMQLEVWKDLAIGKQMLIRAATDALQLDPDCTQEELKVALDAAITHSINADAEVAKAWEQSQIAVATIEKKLAETQKAMEIAEAGRTGALATQEKLQQQLVDERNAAAKELNKLKERLTEKERALKAVNTALADTPENVVKKMKALKKQKMDEANARKRAEETANTLRKEKQKLEQTAKETKTALENTQKLAEKYQELHTLCSEQHDQLKPLVDDPASLPTVPMLEAALLETIEKSDSKDEKKSGGKGKGKARR